MDHLLGTFSPVDPEEFHDFNNFSTIELERQEEAIKEDIAQLETWLGSPPPEATDAEIRHKISEWDEARQWLDAVCCKLYGDWRMELRQRELMDEIRYYEREIDDRLMDDPKAKVSDLFRRIEDLNEELHRLN